MKYLFILDYTRLDQGTFLKHFARSLAGLKLDSFMMIHADSEYTSRITETGVLTETARIRATKELNHRLTALFADEGIPLIAINGYQRKTIVKDGNKIRVNANFLKELGTKTNVLLSNLIEDENGMQAALPLAQLAEVLHETMNFTYLCAFDSNDNPEALLFTRHDDNPLPAKLPEELSGTSMPLNLLQPAQMTSSEVFQKKLRSSKI
ncbi:MAG: hypothetical protein JJU35_00820 [Balneolales bacterium]|nr:hypothetical protein [Balneolales bacterium]